MESSELLTTGEVAKALAVNPATVTRWADQGKIVTIRTPGGHRRFRRSDVEALLVPSEPSEQAS